MAFYVEVKVLVLDLLDVEAALTHQLLVARVDLTFKAFAGLNQV